MQNAPPGSTQLDAATPVRRRAAWAWPLLLALTFAAAVASWLEWSEAQELEQERRTLIADVLSLESRMSDWLSAQTSDVRALADRLPAQVDNEALLRLPAVTDRLRGSWLSVTVLDGNNRLLAHVPQLAPRPPTVPVGGSIAEGSLSAHLVAVVDGGGRLIVRFEPASLLRQTVPWWLSRKYDVRLVDDYGQRIATTGDAVPAGPSQSYRVSMEPQMVNTFLELTTLEVHLPWWRTLPLALMGVFVLLSAAASWSLRRQMHEVASAEDRWHAEAAWRRAMEDALTVGLRGRDAQGRLVHVNRAFCELVGYTPEQLLGKVPPLPYWLPDAKDEHMQRLARTMAGAAPREGYESRWRRSDGRLIDVMLFESALPASSGQPMTWVSSVVDVTARKEAEERERKQLELLGHQARLSTLGEVASALAHQLNQPLAALASYTAGVQASLERAAYADAPVLEAVRRCSEQVDEAGRIVQRIRGFLSRHAPTPEPCSLEDVVNRALTLLRSDFKRFGVTVETVLSSTLPRVLADPVLVEQVLINLLRNALDAMREHPWGQASLRVQLSCAGERFVRLDVEDQGPGLGGLSIEQLAAPFYSTKTDGMGMGLAICRSVIEAHHGALEAGPSGLGGARLSFTLPVVALT